MRSANRLASEFHNTLGTLRLELNWIMQAISAMNFLSLTAELQTTGRSCPSPGLLVKEQIAKREGWRHCNERWRLEAGEEIRTGTEGQIGLGLDAGLKVKVGTCKLKSHLFHGNMQGNILHH